MSYVVNPLFFAAFTSLCSHALSPQSTIVQPQDVSEVPNHSQSSFLLDKKFQFLQCCLLYDFFVTDFVFSPKKCPWYPSLKFVMCCFQDFFLCDKGHRLQATVLNIVVITSDIKILGYL